MGIIPVLVLLSLMLVIRMFAVVNHHVSFSN
jgi:hypothetical protein